MLSKVISLWWSVGGAAGGQHPNLGDTFLMWVVREAGVGARWRGF